MNDEKRPEFRRLAAALLALGAMAGVWGLTGCDSGPPERARAVTPDSIQRDMPSVLRGVIGSESTLRGTTPTLVSGYGIVVGLNNTGSSDIPAAVRGLMEREMSLRGVGQESRGGGDFTPSQLLNSRNTAVVLVRAVIPPGAPVGTKFDVLVTALPGTSTTSLEGGTLWTVDLRRGLQSPGAPDTPALATAHGEVFINPFADPASDGRDAISRTTGRILNGGEVKSSLPLTLSLDSPSHARARSMVSAINSRFPKGEQDREPIARGINEELIEINVPRRYRNDTTEFIELLLASRIDVAFPQEWANRYSRAMREQPEIAMQLGWRLQALGEPALPFLRDLYDYGEIVPRLEALRAGAAMGDPLATPHLLELAREGDPPIRPAAIELLAEMPPDPQVNNALRRLLAEDELNIRIAAYEALASRGDPMLSRRRVAGKFLLDVVPSEKPMVYVSQAGLPRIVVFGSGLTLKRPLLASGWSDRLMLTADSRYEDIRVYYLDHRTQEATQAHVKPDIERFIRFLAHEQSPEHPAPGLDLSYSEVVGALHEVWKENGFEADFVAEQDRLAAELMASFEDIVVEERPETIGGDEPAPGEEGLRQVEAAPSLPALPGQDRPETARDGDSERKVDDSEQRKNYIVPLPGSSSPKK